MAEAALQRKRLMVLLATLAISVPLVLGFFGRLHPALDAFSHFRIHLAVLLLFCGIALIDVKQWLHASAAILLSVCCFLVTMPHVNQWSEAYPAAPSGQPVYKLLQLNVFMGNTEPKTVLSLIARQHPDRVTLEEITDAWRGELDLIKAAYPYRLDCREGEISTVLLSRRPIKEGSCAPIRRFVMAEVDLNGRVVDVVALHLPWPWPFEQANTIQAVASLLQTLGDTAIASGDFNATPWSHTVLELAELGGFTRTERFGPTWMGHRIVPSALKFLGLPIDQVMTKGRIVVHSAKTLEQVGSDHLPVLVEFSLAPHEDESQPSQSVLASAISLSQTP